MQNNFEIRIREFHKLKKGWHFGKGKPFTAKHVDVAAAIALRYFNKFNLSVSGTPCIDGSIDLSFNKHDAFLDIKILPEIGNAAIKFSRGIGCKRTEEDWGTLTFAELDDIFDKFNNIP